MEFVTFVSDVCNKILYYCNKGFIKLYHPKHDRTAATMKIRATYGKHHLQITGTSIGAVSVKMNSAEVEVDVERLDTLDCDVINEHLRTSTSFLHDIMSRDREGSENEEPKKTVSPKRKKTKLKKGFVQSRSACKQCGKTFRTPTTLHAHVLLKHGDSKLSKCDKCDKTYASQLGLDKHVRYMHLRHRCAVCYKTFDNAQSLSEHTNVCIKMNIVCVICDNVYSSAVSLRNHVKYMHPKKTGHWCALCRRGFVSEANLENHRRTVHPAGATDCSCGKRFPSLARLQSHVLYRHTDGHKCRHCHKAFATAARLGGHISRLHSG